MAAHFTIHVGPLGEGHVLVNGDDVTALTAGSDLSVRPGQPTTLSLHMIGGADIEGEGIIHCTTPGGGVSEVVDLVEGLDPDLVWDEAMMGDMTRGPCGAVLDVVVGLLRDAG